MFDLLAILLRYAGPWRPWERLLFGVMVVVAVCVVAGLLAVTLIRLAKGKNHAPKNPPLR